MANFLNRLAARAVGVAPVAQPVIPALFTPGFGLERTDLPSDVAVERVADPSERSVFTESARLTTLPGPGESSNAHTVPRASSNASLSASFPAEQEPPSRFRQEQVSIAADKVATTQPAFSPNLPGPLSETHPENIESSTAYQVSPSSFQPAFEPESGSSRLNTTKLASVQEVPRARFQAPRGFKFGRTLPTNTRTMPERRDPAAGLESEAPVIRVTIGRIDVRAQFSTPAPFPAAARHVRPAALSLDDYLKQRSEGKR